MNSTLRSSESLPSLHSFQSIQKRLNESRHSSVHLLAYLAQDSERSINSVTSHEVREASLYEDGFPGEPLACHEAWWNDFIDLKSFNLRPFSNFEVDITPNSPPMNRVEHSRFDTTPTRPRHRPPPLELDPRIISSRKENMAPSSPNFPPKPKLTPKDTEFDSSSPWYILNQFPTPPTTPSVMRGSKTSTSLYRISRKVNNLVPSPAPILKDHPKEHIDDQPALRVIRKRRQSSFGSLGKAFKTTSASIPDTPPPIPPVWLQSDPMSEKNRETKSISGLQQRDTLKSRLFSIGASPKTIPRDLGAGGRRLPSPPSGRTMLGPENRSVSDSARKSLVLRQNSKPLKPRLRSVSQPNQSKDKRDKMEPDALGLNEDIPPLPIDIEKHLIIPERRTRTLSYINLYVPPRKQVGSSPTQVSFPLEGEVPPALTTPTSGRFELPDEIMHLPACGSVRSLTAELDPFGAGEPASFFRSEYGAPSNTIEVDQDASIFYRKISLEARATRKRWSAQQSFVMHRVPDIIISSSGGLKELKRGWILSD
ncbi:hypothetical protein OPQ81_005871 [Rhizoctonia solani]|nr:hypothetical protein OPQ81_005871 [Rhizoctonia solani]